MGKKKRAEKKVRLVPSAEASGPHPPALHRASVRSLAYLQVFRKAAVAGERLLPVVLLLNSVSFESRLQKRFQSAQGGAVRSVSDKALWDTVSCTKGE